MFGPGAKRTNAVRAGIAVATALPLAAISTVAGVLKGALGGLVTGAAGGAVLGGAAGLDARNSTARGMGSAFSGARKLFGGSKGSTALATTPSTSGTGSGAAATASSASGGSSSSSPAAGPAAAATGAAAAAAAAPPNATSSGSAAGDADAVAIAELQRILACKTCYEILGVAPDASAADIRTAYRKLSLRFHPDRNPSTRAVDVSQALNNAYSVIGDEEKRRAYDASAFKDTSGVDLNAGVNIDITVTRSGVAVSTAGAVMGGLLGSVVGLAGGVLVGAAGGVTGTVSRAREFATERLSAQQTWNEAIAARATDVIKGYASTGAERAVGIRKFAPSIHGDGLENTLDIELEFVGARASDGDSPPAGTAAVAAAGGAARTAPFTMVPLRFNEDDDANDEHIAEALSHVSAEDAAWARRMLETTADAVGVVLGMLGAQREAGEPPHRRRIALSSDGTVKRVAAEANAAGSGGSAGVAAAAAAATAGAAGAGASNAAVTRPKGEKKDKEIRSAMGLLSHGISEVSSSVQDAMLSSEAQMWYVLARTYEAWSRGRDLQPSDIDFPLEGDGHQAPGIAFIEYLLNRPTGEEDPEASRRAALAHETVPAIPRIPSDPLLRIEVARVPTVAGSATAAATDDSLEWRTLLALPALAARAKLSFTPMEVAKALGERERDTSTGGTPTRLLVRVKQEEPVATAARAASGAGATGNSQAPPLQVPVVHGVSSVCSEPVTLTLPIRA